MIFGWVIEITIIIVLAYIYPINIAIGTRDLSLLQFGFYSTIFSILLLTYDELRKLMM
jgi:hypothetical protein